MFEIYKNKKVFITGHTGFKGSWLALWLKKLGANVAGYSLQPPTCPSLFKTLNLEKEIKSTIGNILDEKLLSKAMADFKPDIVFHLAAQPLVRLSYKEPSLTYKTNVIGTLNVLEAAKNTNSVNAFVNVTTDKCYENIEKNYKYKEDDKMGGYDMYSSSKACAEILSASYRSSFLKDSFLLATVRAGNVIGGGDWALDRLIPDCVRSLINEKDIIIRNPNAIRPWQHVLEPLNGYLTVGEKLLQGNKEFADSFNFGPEDDSLLPVSEIVKIILNIWGCGKVNVEKSNIHEANLLMLNIEKAKEKLNWRPIYNIKEAVEETIEWYKIYYSNEKNMKNYSLEQIIKFETTKKERK